MHIALTEGVYLYTWLKRAANKIPTEPQGWGQDGKTINQNLPNVHDWNEIMHEPEKQKKDLYDSKFLPNLVYVRLESE